MASRGVPLSEAAFMATVRQMCTVLGLLVYHSYDSRRSPSGFPDLTVVGARVLFRELKTDTGRVTSAQQQWLEALRTAGADAEVWRPEDLRSGRIAAELRNLKLKVSTS